MDEKTKKIVEDVIAEVGNAVLSTITAIKVTCGIPEWELACDQIYEELERDVFGSE